MWDFLNTYDKVLDRNTDLRHLNYWLCFELPQCKFLLQAIDCFSWKSQSALPKLGTCQARFLAFFWTAQLPLSIDFPSVKSQPEWIQPDHSLDLPSIKCYMIIHIYSDHLVSNTVLKAIPKLFHALNLFLNTGSTSWSQFRHFFHKYWSSWQFRSKDQRKIFFSHLLTLLNSWVFQWPVSGTEWQF